MEILSPAFKHNQKIPKIYTCQGEKINPPLVFSNIPEDAKFLALIVEDPDAVDGLFVHWILHNMPIVNKLKQNASLGQEGITTLGTTGYVPPCPPNGKHRYFFKLYALSEELNIEKECDKDNLIEKMNGKILAEASLIGLYEKK